MLHPIYAALLAAGLLSAAGAAAHAGQSGSALATIAIEPTDTGVRLTGKAVALAAVSLDAKMTIERTGTAGRTATSQGGAFQLKAGERADVASVGLSMAPGDRLSVELVLSVDGQPIARSVVETSR
ncbi:curli-like amyloid fiber formation chaperone CsgH [Consotaella salsifontis]|uniref:Curli assembly protein CsgC n=1 Tax=Consotaella salsifontis TaxID=1365950 RepID=A0A1T4SEV8_9HYPH|nr:curli-like amyloid fiber formation chaperone CsgH [Consotaella salsifontis]SKA26824.1 hypothetical protein SAMN05428963_110125 [Consotaella salsifontis]